MNPTGEEVAAFLLAALWRASWQGGIAVACVSLLELAAPSLPAQTRSWLWRLVFVKFAVTLVWSTGIPLPILPPPQAPEAFTHKVMESESLSTSTESVRTTTRATSPTWNWTYTFAACWAVGTAIVLYRQHRSGRRPQRDLRWSTPLVADDLEQALRVSAARLGLSNLPRLRRITGPGGPRLVGVWRPQLLFPADWLAKCTATQRRLAIAHELAHVARHDLAWNRLAAWCQAVFFFHPLVWWAGRRYLLAQELACDALVLTKVEAAPGEYARLLYDLMNQPAGAMWDGSAAMTGAWVTLRERVWAMKRGTGLRPTWAAGLAITLGATLGLAPFSLAQQKIVSPSEESAPTLKKSVVRNGMSASASASGTAIANGNGQVQSKVQANASVSLGGAETGESPNDRPKSPGESPNDRPAKSSSASRVKQTMTSEDNGDGEKWTRTTEATEGKREIRIEETADEIRVVTRVGDEKKVVTGKDAADLRRQSQAAFDTYRKYVKDGKGVSASVKAGSTKTLGGGKAVAGGNAGGKAFGNAGGNAFGGGDALGEALKNAFGNAGGNAFGGGDANAGGFNGGGDPKEALRQFKQAIEANGIGNPAFDDMLKELEAELDK